MRARVVGWLAAGVVPVALLAGCARTDTPGAGGSGTGAASTLAAATTGAAPPASDIASVTEPPTDPVTQPVTEPVTEPGTAPPTAPPTEPPATPAPGPPAPAPRGATRVIVLNAGYKDGGAGATTDGLSAIGYQVLPAENAYEDRRQSAVYFHEGWELSAREIAEAAGISQDLVAPMPDLEISDTDPRDYDVAVLLGRDRR